MSSPAQNSAFYAGWDVGGWNCDKNSNSRDAIVILDSALTLVGSPWRGNLRTVINSATSADEWIEALFVLCNAKRPANTQLTLAIDTPLGFSLPLVRLLTKLECVEPVTSSDTNPYLFRQTEHYLFKRGLKPLSAVKDMIGSQATKGMHVLSKFAPQVASCGVWTNGAALSAIEAYPSGCKGSDRIQQMHSRYAPLGHVDKADALTCALIAYLHANNPEALVYPGTDVPLSEGWIWLPIDSF